MKMLFNSSNTLIPCAMQSKIKIQDCHWLIQMVNRAQASTEWAPKSLRFVNWRNHRDGAVVFRAMIRVNRSTANVFIKRIFRADVAVFDHGIDGEADRTWGGGDQKLKEKKPVARWRRRFVWLIAALLRTPVVGHGQSIEPLRGRRTDAKATALKDL